MQIVVQLNQFSILVVPVSILPEAQLIFHQPEMQKIMPNPTHLIEFLELNEPSFSAILLDYFSTDDEDKYKEAMKSFQVSSDMFINYLAHCFEVPKQNVKIEL